MKIRKIANQYEDEGFDAEEQVEEMDNAQAQQELSDEAVGKGGYTPTSKVLMAIRDNFGEPIQASWVGNGSVGWFEVDGVIYEIGVAPAAYGRYYDYFKELLARDSKPEVDPEDDLPM